MITLGIEQSTQQRSVALRRDGELVASASWLSERGKPSPLLTHVEQTLRKGNCPLADVDVFAVGRGPGNYSGLRVAMSTATAFALPDQKIVYAMSSGEALAHEVADRHDACTIAILGDARRNTLWFALFDKVKDGVVQSKEWTLLQRDNVMAELPQGCIAASPDWDRLSTERAAIEQATSHTLSDANYPAASTLAAVAEKRIREGIPSEALSPIYMHPAVASKA